jgi:hypothetical protein
MPDRYDVPHASTAPDRRPPLNPQGSARGAGIRWMGAAGDFFPTTDPVRVRLPAGTARGAGTRRRITRMLLVGVLLAGLLAAFAVSTVITFPKVSFGSAPTAEEPQHAVADGSTSAEISVPITATAGRGYLLTVPPTFAAESPALDGSDVSLISTSTGTALSVTSHVGKQRPALLVKGREVHAKIADIEAAGVTHTASGRVTQVLEFRHDRIWYVVTETADATTAKVELAVLAKVLREWEFSGPRR